MEVVLERHLPLLLVDEWLVELKMKRNWIPSEVVEEVDYLMFVEIIMVNLLMVQETMVEMAY